MPTHNYPYKNLVFEGGGVKGVARGRVRGAGTKAQITPQIEPTLTSGGDFRRSPRSGRQHKAWGGAQRNPRNRPLKKYLESAKRPIAVRLHTSIVMIPLPAALRAMNNFRRQFLGFRYAPPQALCHGPL